jgi:Ser-tRNA(Ala) deacylase AlaX
VENVQRRGLVAVHHVRVPPELVDKAEDVLGPGKTVDMVVDWERRFDHVRERERLAWIRGTVLLKESQPGLR